MNESNSTSSLKNIFIILLFSTLVLCSLMLVNMMMMDKQISISNSTMEDFKTYHKYNINCGAIYDMDPVEVEKSLIIRQKQIVEDTDESLSQLTSDCPKFIRARGYDDICVSEEERDFPIAYSLVVHKYAWLVERLIRVIYSPGNIYCIHYDAKSPALFRSAMEGLANCLPNVFIVSKREVIHYTSFSRVQADLNCFVDLLKSDVKWKYIINLCGQDIPLKTNRELVSELRKLNGSNMLETTLPRLKAIRYTHHYKFTDDNWLVRTDQLKPPAPHGLEMFVGNAYFVLSREFIVYMSTSVVVKDFLAWLEDTYAPEETIWATLVRIPGIPGEVPRSSPDIGAMTSKTRLVKWIDYEPEIYPLCTGTHIRGICIFGAAEIHWLLNCGFLFANKLDPKVDPVAIQCFEEILMDRQKIFSCT